MERVTYNIKNVHYALVSISEAGTVTFGETKQMPGATAIDLPPIGERVKKYADGKVWVIIAVNQGYDGTLSLFRIPEAFAEDCLGMTIDSNGVQLEKEGAVQKNFALLFEFDTDTTETKRGLLFNCNAGRPNINSATTEETIDPQPFSIPITAAPADDTGFVKASILGDSTDATWSSWFSSVYTPEEAAQQKVTVTIDDGGAPAAGIADALVVCGGKIARTDTAGNAYFMLPAGDYDILVSAEDYVADTDSVTVVAAAVTKTISLLEVT